MPRVLLISSFTSASQVGAVPSAFALRRLGIDVTVLPTTLFGRHPGWGPPGGRRVASEDLRDMWRGVAAQDVKYDAVMTGYMGEIGHVTLAAEIIAAVRPKICLVDPVMGDHEAGGLYIDAERADALAENLLPLATIATPNLFEFERLTGGAALGALDGVAETVITSIAKAGDPGAIGARLFAPDTKAAIFHDRFEDVPNGGGDALAALYLGHRLLGETAETAFIRAVSSVFEIMRAANRLDAGELPIVRAQSALESAPPLPLERGS